ncbi:ABC transporter permease [Agrobacterium sp. Azo12]|jgi:iron(III) transport system permease protein|uniref:ABC transporter permease n=1 Tax=Agrobacterium sp. Azo12 TaxID=3031129 RepID=UPI0023D83866|nr:iron ABC transporter permease [Agrobacterium sp. Azo12]MDO5898060.1 iron ABC transporter permease [Agrobacterium sp. Azo12]
MTTATATSTPASRFRMPGFWTVITALAVILLAVFLLLPIVNVLAISFFDASTGDFGISNYVQVLTRRFYTLALWNTIVIGLLGMLGACLIGIPLAFCTSRYRIRGRAVIATFAVLVLCAPPFIGAYAWIMLFGSNGAVTNALQAVGLPAPTIYGIPGIVMVFSLKFFPYIYLMTENALNTINKSYEDAAENLGCTAFQRFYKVTLPLIFPAVSTGAIICFVLSIADFGTPAILGRGVRTLATIAYAQYTSEMGGTPTMAVTVSMLMIAISMIALLLQRRILSKRRYASALTNRPVKRAMSPLKSLFVHGFCYLVVFIAMLPAFTVVYTSFLETSGPVFTGNFGLGSYERILRDSPQAIYNSFLFSLAAVAMIAVVSGLLSFIVVRKDNVVSGSLDLVLMVPYLIPGVVMAIGYVATFRHPPFDITGTALIIILLVFIRRLPYGVRSTTSILRQIKPSIEEAAVNLGASPAKTFASVTVPLMMPGLIIGSLMSFITAINELSSTLILYTSRTVTMPVLIYVQVIDGEFGTAAALSTLLLASTGLCVFIVFRFSDRKESAFV